MCFRLYKYLIMLFKLINTSAIFQTYTNYVLKKHLNVFIVVYLNDMLIYSKNKQKHRKNIRDVLATLKKADLRIKLEKS